MKEFKSFKFEFNLKTKTKFGVGTAVNLGKYLKDLSFTRIGIITDPGVTSLKYTEEILENLQKEGFSKVQIWEYNLNAEPDYESLDKVKAMFLDNNSKPIVDCFVGIGGGSVMDFAKGLATLVVNPGKAITYRGFPTDINPSLPTIALPTTAGTGSEVTYNAVFIDRKDKKKLGINTMYNFPVMAILDPKLTLSCPKSVTVSSGIDALVHTLESYVARQSNPLTRTFAKEAFKLIYNNLYKVLDNPKNIEIRANLQLGAYLAGISLMNSGSGPAGALSYPPGVYFKVPHGLAGGVFLPHIIEHNIKNGYDYSELYNLIENTDKSINSKEKNKLFSKKLFELCKKLGVPSTLRVFGVNEANIGVLLKETEHLDKAFAQNPVPFSVEDGKKLLMKMIENQEEEKR
jgi:alcohol dehydrogenase class IV